MAHFIGNEKITFDSEKIVVVNWNCTDHNELTYTEVRLIEENEVCLYFTDDADFELINNLRDCFGYEALPRVR